MATIPSTERRTTASPIMLNVNTTRSQFRIPRTLFTLAGFRNWVKKDDFPDKVKVSFIDGEIYIDADNEELQTHVAVKGEILRAVMTLEHELDLGRYFGSGVLFTNESANLCTNPDALFVTWETWETRRVQLVPRKNAPNQFDEMIGSPDWMLEVLSDSSVRKDTVRLRAAYHRAGVREYWIVDARGDEIDLSILTYRKNGYARAAVKDGWSRSLVFGRSFRFTREKDRLGLWEYTLHIRED